MALGRKWAKIDPSSLALAQLSAILEAGTCQLQNWFAWILRSFPCSSLQNSVTYTNNAAGTLSRSLAQGAGQGKCRGKPQNRAVQDNFGLVSSCHFLCGWPISAVTFLWHQYQLSSVRVSKLSKFLKNIF